MSLKNANYPWFIIHGRLRVIQNYEMDTIKILNSNVDRLCDEREWSHKKLAKEMGVNEAVLSRALSGNPQLKTIEKMAKALDVSIKSLFEDSNDVEGFVLLHGNPYHFNSLEEFSNIGKYTKPIRPVIIKL